jgi:hypothetical protein
MPKLFCSGLRRIRERIRHTYFTYGHVIIFNGAGVMYLGVSISQCSFVLFGERLETDLSRFSGVHYMYCQGTAYSVVSWGTLG